MQRENLLTMFGEFERYRKDVAVIQRRGYRREAMTYGRLAGVAISLALELKDRGVRTGDRVLLWGPNSAEWIAAFWGCLLRGAVPVPMDDAATLEFVMRVASEASVRMVLVSREKPAFDPAIPRLVLQELADTVRHPHVHDTMRAPGEPRKVLYQTLAEEAISRNHVAEILFTSGTTSEPRGVVLTHGNILANLEPIERGVEPYRKYERWLHPLRFVSLVPLSHMFGQFMALFVPPLLGTAVAFEQSSNPGEVIRTVKRERATALITVPRMLDILHSWIETELEAKGQGEWLRKNLEAANEEKFLQRAWRFRRMHRRLGWKFWAFISGGAALSSDIEDFFKRLGYAVVQGYGLTEAAALISLNHPFRTTQGSVGKVLPGREFRLAEDGEILVRGENVASGYWEAGKVKPSGEQGWLRTGDIGELDDEGNLRFRGRKKNVIVTPAGLNVYPEDVEAAIRKQKDVRDCVVIPLEMGGNAEPCAVLLLAGGADGEAAALVIASANASLAEYQRIRSWVTWLEPDFPRTPTGKPRLKVIAAQAAESLSDAPSGEGSPGVLDDLLEKFASRSKASERLEEGLRLSSLDRVELMSALEERFQVELNETALAEAKTVEDVQRLLEQPSAHRTEFVYPRWTQRAPMRWLRLAVYYALVWPATQILAHPKIVGSENLRDVRGPLLFISNHVTRRADIGLILAALPMRFRHHLATAMGGETLQNMRHPPRDWFFVKRWAYQFGYWLVIALFNVFPMPRHSGFRDSFRFAGESVDRGYSVLVFPEGVTNESEDGRMGPFQSGIGLLAENLGIPIVPMRFDGVWQMKRERRRLAGIGEIIVRIGKPVSFPPGTPPGDVALSLESLVRSL